MQWKLQCRTLPRDELADPLCVHRSWGASRDELETPLQTLTHGVTSNGISKSSARWRKSGSHQNQPSTTRTLRKSPAERIRVDPCLGGGSRSKYQEYLLGLVDGDLENRQS